MHGKGSRTAATPENRTGKQKNTSHSQRPREPQKPLAESALQQSGAIVGWKKYIVEKGNSFKSYNRDITEQQLTRRLVKKFSRGVSQVDLARNRGLL